MDTKWTQTLPGTPPPHPAASPLAPAPTAATLTQLAASVLSAWLGIRGARALHTAMLDCVACCPVHFFDTAQGWVAGQAGREEALPNMVPAPAIPRWGAS